MSTQSELLYYSSNLGKFKILSNYLRNFPVSLLSPAPDYQINVEESDNCLDNAVLKALTGSKVSQNYFCIGNDDSLFFKNLNDFEQPLTNIYRNKQSIENQTDIIRHYQQKLTQIKSDSVTAEITSCYAIAKDAKVLGTIKLKYQANFVLPPLSYFDEGMPLSAFHYFRSLGKYYPELSDFQKQIYHQKQLKGLDEFIARYVN